MGVGESVQFLAKSPYIRDLATLVVAYGERGGGEEEKTDARQARPNPNLHPDPAGISINLVEVTWKSKIKAQFPNPNDYSAFMGDFSTATGEAGGGGRGRGSKREGVAHALSHSALHTAPADPPPPLSRRRDLPDDDRVPRHLPQVRLGRGRDHHADRAPDHGRRVLRARPVGQHVCAVARDARPHPAHGGRARGGGPERVLQVGQVQARAGGGGEASVFFFRSFRANPTPPPPRPTPASHSLFDPCKEMAYIPLDRDLQVKGKAAIDVICNPLGKSGGSAIQQVLILTFGSLATSTPYLAAVLLVIVIVWLRAAASLDKQFTAAQLETGAVE